tara:strand:+ start:633 stop:1289 length:657 start_codon:yes stop_codon:yes gene_type:complete
MKIKQNQTTKNITNTLINLLKITFLNEKYMLLTIGLSLTFYFFSSPNQHNIIFLFCLGFISAGIYYQRLFYNLKKNSQSKKQSDVIKESKQTNQLNEIKSLIGNLQKRIDYKLDIPSKKTEPLFAKQVDQLLDTPLINSTSRHTSSVFSFVPNQDSLSDFSEDIKSQRLKKLFNHSGISIQFLKYKNPSDTPNYKSVSDFSSSSTFPLDIPSFLINYN